MQLLPMTWMQKLMKSSNSDTDLIYPVKLQGKFPVKNKELILKIQAKKEEIIFQISPRKERRTPSQCSPMRSHNHAHLTSQIKVLVKDIITEHQGEAKKRRYRKDQAHYPYQVCPDPPVLLLGQLFCISFINKM